MVSPSRKNFRKSFRLDHAFLDYNGGCEDYEDPADYVRSRGGMRGVVIA